MMLVKTKLKPSPIEGLGLFADEDIPSGTPVWQFKPGFDLLINPGDMAFLSSPAREQFLKYAYLSKNSGMYVLCFDDARFFNHDAIPNVSCAHSTRSDDREDICVTNRKISLGEELTCNYREFDAGSPEYFIQSNCE